MDMNLQDLEMGSVILFIKNEDGTFSPLSMNDSQNKIVTRVIAGLSENSSLVVLNQKLSIIK